MSDRMTWRHRLAARTLRRALKRLTRAMNHAVAVEYGNDLTVGHYKWGITDTRTHARYTVEYTDTANQSTETDEGGER